MVSSAVRNLAVLATAMILLPLLAGDLWAYEVSLYLTYGIVATGLGLAWGLSGTLSLGHGLYMAISAYLAANVFIVLDGSGLAWPAAFLCALVPMVIAFIIAFGVFRGQTGNATSFSMVTLALALAGGQIAIGWSSVTGGFNGLLGVPPLPGISGIIEQYALVGAATLVVCAGYVWLISAPLGTVWKAVAADERRMQFLGFDTALLKALAFAVSGFCAGLGGVIYAQQQGIVTPDLTGFAFCGSLLVYVAVGGRMSVFGPLVGALVVGLLSSELRDRVDWWELVLALVFIVVVLRFPKGLAGIIPTSAAVTNLSMSVEAPRLKGERSALSCQLQGVSVKMGSVRILNGLNFFAEQGKTTCIIGPNGAGKSSSFNALTGLLPLSGGALSLDGKPIRKATPAALTLAGVSRKFQAPTVFPALTIRENLSLGLWSKRASTVDLLNRRLWQWNSPLLAELKRRFEFLAEDAKLASDLSHGQRQILELSMVLLTEPRLLLLDEPCAGLSQDETFAVIDLAKWIRAKTGMTIVVVEHDMALVEALADTVNVFHQGRFLAKGTIEEVRANDDVRNVYVGGQR
ncbi:ATP-binding cassette domain-containing protein [Rhizobium sp. ICMP 5592]|uniref:branched-chain amino acid ABC transporter ATP-binding protein/permease n=1 Tax=Rhizobium sp. ICMP 5592 TaxID=2292445 RepID=UPI00336AD66F|nr:ATP-binding cassette domain-containing protein [Rhizobium sp. ICMP 5592]